MYEPSSHALTTPLQGRQLRNRVLGFLLLALLTTSSVVAVALYAMWQEAINSERRQNSNLAQVLQEQTLRVFTTMDHATLRMVDEFIMGDFTPEDYTRIANETGLAPEILTQLSLVGPDGRFVGSNLDPTGDKTQRVDLSEREHIRIHLEPEKVPDSQRQISASGLFVGKPVLGKVSGKWTIQLSRSIRDSSGALHGVVVASLNPNYFEKVFSEVDLGPKGVVALTGNDSTVRARVMGGRADSMGRTLDMPLDHPLLQFNERTGVYQRKSLSDDVDRIAAFKRVQGYPLTVVVSTATDMALQEWENMRTLALVFAGLFCAALIASGLAFLRGVQQLERKNLELAASEAQAQSANQAKSEFLAAISHELRTPLTSIRGFAELMEHRLEQPTFREAATLIRKAAEHLHTLLSEILDLAKVEAGAMNIVLAEHSVPELMHTTIDFFAISAAQKNLNLSLRITPEVPELLLCDGLRLKQILNNLLSNALKFTEQGSVVLEVDATASAVRIHVVDTGPGIHPDKHDLIFEKFRQGSADVCKEHGGTGLGLALSRTLAELMGGKLTVESSLGHGARFTLTLPRNPQLPTAS